MSLNKHTIYVDMDGTIADFAKGYKDAFNRDAYADDSITVRQFCLQIPHFFRFLPVIDKGRELIDLFKDDYKVVFLTTPMLGMTYCRRDKLEWIKEHFGKEYDVIFSDKKENYVVDEKNILIDDMNYNLKLWQKAGGTAINIKLSIDKIFEIIEEILYGKQAIAEVKKQLEEIVINSEPSERQKEIGNYKKGRIKFKGMDIMIENVPGSIRFGFDERGKKWIQRMKNYYGYIKGTEGNDFDPVDCFIGPKLNMSKVFVINQANNGLFDEVKCMLGFEDIESAKSAYLSNYQKGWEKNIMSIVPTNTKLLRDWLKSGNYKESFKNKI